MSANSISSLDARMKEADDLMRNNSPDWKKAALCWKKLWDEMPLSDVRAPGCLYRATYCYLQTNLEDRKEKKHLWTRQIKSRLDHLAWVRGCSVKREALAECRVCIKNVDSYLCFKLDKLIQDSGLIDYTYVGMLDESSKC